MIDLDAMIRDAGRESTPVWFESFAKIRVKSGELVRTPANTYQRRISEAIEWCDANQRPVRLVCLKPRQKGSSTYSVAELYHRMQTRPGNRGLIAGGAHFQGANLFKILDTYAQSDELWPKSCKVLDMEARFLNTSTVERLTLANKNAGRSGTYQALITTEVAYLSEEGVANADEVLAGLLKCVPFLPGTLIIEESTAKGATGFFYDRWNQAITLEEAKAGKPGDYIRIFAAWFEFPESRKSPESEGIRSLSDLSRDEIEYAERWGLDIEQIAWRRWAIRSECNGDERKFQQDYPTDPETAFLKSGRGRFCVNGLRYQRDLVRTARREFGMLEHRENIGAVLWRPTSEDEATVVRFEEPRAGLSYVVAVDPMTGESQTSGDDPDSHSVVVLRRGYMQQGVWHEPAVVMRNMCFADGQRFGCWWDIDILTEQVWRMARYWQATIIPEIDMDRGMIELLKMRGDVSIYRRRMFNRRENTETDAYGFATDKVTRPRILEDLARAIREAGRGVVGDGIEVRCPWILRQLENFVIKKSGREEAASGHHDDDVLALAIALFGRDESAAYALEERREDNWGRLTPRNPVRSGQWS